MTRLEKTNTLERGTKLKRRRILGSQRRMSEAICDLFIGRFMQAEYNHYHELTGHPVEPDEKFPGMFFSSQIL